ncbi:MAG TPA: two-component system response regulator CreB [Pseudomonadales bacterium]|nr:two-component system response regulator CreB [Pseudomonadales bacterium]
MTINSAPHILLIEDDEDIAATIIYALEREQYFIHHCTTGVAAEQWWKEHPVDIAILDVGLPDQTGFELCRKLKAAYPDRPVMFLTAHNDEIDRIVGLELGAEDYLCKPFSPRELVLRIKTILRRNNSQPAQESPALLQHDAEKMQIIFHGKHLTLTKSEYLLLSGLLKQPGRVFTRDNLLDILGDVSGNSSDRAIDTHVKELRTKLRTIDSSREFIITHRGLGYSLADNGSAT